MKDFTIKSALVFKFIEEILNIRYDEATRHLLPTLEVVLDLSGCQMHTSIFANGGQKISLRFISSLI